MAKRYKYTYMELEQFIATAHDRYFIAGLVQTATDLWKQGDLTDFSYSGLLQKAASKVISL